MSSAAQEALLLVDRFTKFMSPEDVREISLKRSTNISQHYETLNTIVQRHELTIRKRWKKRTQPQRLNILVNAWGGSMLQHHRPDFRLVSKMSYPDLLFKRAPSSSEYEAFMWSYINQEDLLDSNNLLLLINSRARHEPVLFAGADFEATRLGRVFGAISPIILPGYHLQLSCHAIASTYSTLRNASEPRKSVSNLHLREEYTPGDGLIILEVQERIMSFLVECAKRLLIDFTPDMLYHAPIQEQPPSLSETSSGLTTFTSIAAEEPYLLPPRVEIDAIWVLLKAKRDEAADHLWSLREDPDYFLNQMLEAKDHRFEHVRFTDGRLQPLVRSKNGDDL